MEYQKTIILSSNNPNHGLFLNGDVFLMKDGKILESGEASRVITKENLIKIYGKKNLLF